MCPSCLSGGLGAGYYAAFAICGLFFVIAAGALFWAARAGKLDNMEESKFSVLED
ncbi:MAG: hypothetical protein VKK59_04515 [Vampirovibrionales bacterium]|nr:hypothetical protein [Vampirovibrionales bacterium]